VGPWVRAVSGIARPELHGTTATGCFMDISPAPVFWIVFEGRSVDVRSPLGRRPCVGTYSVSARKSVLLCRRLFRVLSVLLRTPVTSFFFFFGGGGGGCAECTILFLRGCHLRMRLTGHAHPPFLLPPTPFLPPSLP
jgi:hypothetical protein